MRHPPSLTEKQRAYLYENGHLSNIELAKTLGVSTDIIATYKSRGRRKGMQIPYLKTPLLMRLAQQPIVQE